MLRMIVSTIEATSIAFHGKYTWTPEGCDAAQSSRRRAERSLVRGNARTARFSTAVNTTESTMEATSQLMAKAYPDLVGELRVALFEIRHDGFDLVGLADERA